MARKSKTIKPKDLLSLGRLQQKMWITASETIWHRCRKLSTGGMTPGEFTAMIVEKPTTLMTGFQKGVLAAAKGENPVKVASAALRPITAKTASNARRLKRRKPAGG